MTVSVGVSIDTCVITVPGNGRGGYGHPVKDRTGTVESFLVDNQVFYAAVQKHLKVCASCSPQEVLERLLERRKATPRFAGQTSQTQVRLARRWFKAFPGRVRPTIVREFVARSGVSVLVEMPEYMAGAEYLVLSTAFDWARSDESLFQARSRSVMTDLAGTAYESVARVFLECAERGAPYPDRDEVRSLVLCARVITS